MSRTFSRVKLWSFVTVAALAVVLLPSGLTTRASAEPSDIRTVLYEGLPIDEFLSDGGMAALFGPDTSSQSYLAGRHGNGRDADAFVNDPCLDPAPPGREGTAQSEPEIAVLNTSGSMGKKMVVGYNDSAGFYDRNRGLSGFAYSTDGGVTWIDGGGLPPLIAGSGTADDDGKDAYFGDPSVVVDQATQRFFYASIYKLPDGSYTLSVNRGTFQAAAAPKASRAWPTPAVSTTRCRPAYPIPRSQGRSGSSGSARWWPSGRRKLSAASSSTLRRVRISWTSRGSTSTRRRARST